MLGGFPSARKTDGKPGGSLARGPFPARVPLPRGANYIDKSLWCACLCRPNIAPPKIREKAAVAW
jgi:hypothetical protein